DLLGHGELSSTLADLARAGDWSALPGRLTDDILADLVPQALFADLPATLHHWFAGRCDGLNIALPADPTHDTVFAQVLAEVRSIPGRPAVPSPPEASPSDAPSDERPPA